MLQRNRNKLDKTQLVITALQQRIGELVSNYETQIAVLRAEITQLINEKQDHEKAIQEYSDSLSNLSN
jgi:phage host-nuclease inhibitor protein Gam